MRLLRRPTLVFAAVISISSFALTDNSEAALSITIANNGSGGTQFSWIGTGPYTAVSAFPVDFYLNFGTSIYAANVDPSLNQQVASGIMFVATPPGSNLVGPDFYMGSLKAFFGGTGSPNVLGFITGGTPLGASGTYSASGTTSIPSIPFSLWKGGTYAGAPFVAGFGTDFVIDAATLNVVPEPSSLSLLALGGLGLMRRRR